ncbi:programmed cell death 6-interacting protein-like [Glandiceps talaboti]
MATFVSVPQKFSTEVDLIKPLKTFIANTYGTGDGGEDYGQAVKELNKLRTNACCKTLDKHDSALELICRYYDQLVAIDAKLPITENQIRISFTWQDAFDKGSFFGGAKKQSMSSAGFEKACVLFTIGALQSQIACIQNFESDDGLKKAAKHFQVAAGIYGHLKDQIYSYVPHLKTPDMEPDMLACLSAIMLAQAQEVFFKKAVMDKMKSATIAKIAYQASDNYASAMRLSQEANARETIPKDLYSVLAAKTPYFHGEAEFQQSLVCKTAKNFGEELARLQHASELVEAAHNRGGMSINFKDTAAKIKRNYDDAKKDNDFIYHEKIPNRDRLQAIGKAPIAKALPLGSPMSAKFTDLFENLVPLSVHQAVTAFDNRKAEIVNREVGRLRDKTQFMNGVLTTLNLPAAIEDIGGNVVPPSVLEKARTLQEQGGLESLQRSMSDMPESLTRNKEILEEAVRMMDEEQKSDDQMREQFKERWTRLESAKLTEPLRAEAAKYKGIIDNAIQADHVVKDKFETHRDAIILLSKSERDLAKALPTAGPTATAQGSAAVNELTKLMEQVQTIKAERDVIEQELKDTTVDMKTKFLAALVADGAIDEENMSGQQLDEAYGALIDQVNSSLESQDTLLANVERANMQFCQEKATNKGATEREQILRKLAGGHDAYMELQANLREGSKFYNDLTPLLLRFQSKVADLVFARKTEKEELMKDLQQNIVNRPTGPTPAAPAHHGGQGTSRQPPPRPPPPQTTVQPQTAAPPQAAGASAPPAYAPTYSPYPAYQGYTPPPMPTGYNPYATYPPPHHHQQQQQQQQPPYPTQPAYGQPQYPPQPGYPYPRQ